MDNWFWVKKLGYRCLYNLLGKRLNQGVCGSFVKIKRCFVLKPKCQSQRAQTLVRTQHLSELATDSTFNKRQLTVNFEDRKKTQNFSLCLQIFRGNV
jgi:hypothetical protein